MTELKVPLDTSLPGRLQNNSLAEQNNQFLLLTTSTYLLEVGLPHTLLLTQPLRFSPQRHITITSPANTSDKLPDCHIVHVLPSYPLSPPLKPLLSFLFKFPLKILFKSPLKLPSSPSLRSPL